MSTTAKLLLLHLSQAEQSLERAKNNSYSDQRKEDYQNNLIDLFYAIKADLIVSLPTLNDQQIFDGPKKFLDFIFKSLEFLGSSTLNQIPYEIVACLNHAMDEFLEPTDQFLIVTSLINESEGFSYDSWIAFDDGLYTAIEALYGVKFTFKLVQINLPRLFARDYLVSAVLYHELGHFIDMRYSLMDSLTRDVFINVYRSVYSPAELLVLKEYFPYLRDFIDNPTRYSSLADYDQYVYNLSHFREYFCDLFGAQYIGKASSYYLNYVNLNNSDPSPSHPATTERVKIVDDYLNGTSNFIVDLINQAITRITTKTLQKRFTDIRPDDFFKLVPTIITSGMELHGLINIGWEIWLNHQDEVERQLNRGDTLKVYSVINNLIEKSIGNYITVKKWTTSYQKLHPAIPVTPTTPAIP